MLVGATAKVKTLPLVPTSWSRNWITAVALAVVGVMFEVTVIGKTGGGGVTVDAPAPTLTRPVMLVA
jgi:hypothetical protein